VLAAVVGQDLDQDAEGVFRIARRVAKDRVISTVDTEARHGHKTSSRGFDGYKGHVAIDPDGELITATAVAAANVGDAAVAEQLLAGDLPEPSEPSAGGEDGGPGPAAPDERLVVYGDSGYGAGALIDQLEQAEVDIRCKVQAPTAPAGHFARDAFDVDLQAGTVTCPAGHVAPLRTLKDGRIAYFASACPACPLAAQCTSSPAGRTIRLGLHDGALTRARARQTNPAWKADYKATRPKVERKQAHMMRRRHGGRRARMRGQAKIAADFTLLAAAVNIARLAALGLTSTGATWAITPA
jgi:Transposase DDE domain